MILGRINMYSRYSYTRPVHHVPANSDSVTVVRTYRTIISIENIRREPSPRKFGPRRNDMSRQDGPTNSNYRHLYNQAGMYVSARLTCHRSTSYEGKPRRVPKPVHNCTPR